MGVQAIYRDRDVKTADNHAGGCFVIGFGLPIEIGIAHNYEEVNADRWFIANDIVVC
jgi:hypothetical protein